MTTKGKNVRVLPGLVNDLKKYNSKDLDTLAKFYKLPKLPRELLIPKIARLNLKSKGVLWTAKMPYGDCTNEVEQFSQDDWSADNEPNLKVTFWWHADFSKKPTVQCYDRDNLNQWLATPEHTLYKWIPNTKGRPIDQMGYGGGPTDSLIVQNWPDSQFVIKQDLRNVQNGATLNAYPIAKNMRIGRQFGISQNHGQLPGFVVYQLSPTPPREFYIYKIYMTLFQNSTREECERHFVGYTPEQLFLIVDALAEFVNSSSYDINGNRKEPPTQQQIQPRIQQQIQPQIQPESDSESDSESEREFQNGVREITLNIVSSIPDDIGYAYWTIANDTFHVINYKNYIKITKNNSNVSKYIQNPDYGYLTVAIPESNESSVFVLYTGESFILYEYSNDDTIEIKWPFREEININVQIIDDQERTLLFCFVQKKLAIMEITNRRLLSTTFVNVPKDIKTFIARPDNVLDIFYTDQDVVFRKRCDHQGNDIGNTVVVPNITNISSCNYQGSSIFKTIVAGDNKLVNIDDNTETNVDETIIGMQRINGQLLKYTNTYIMYKNWISDIFDNIDSASGYIIGNNIHVEFISDEHNVMTIYSNLDD
jgi:hypothetical protein